MTTTAENVDAAEINKFSEMAMRWWDTEGPVKTLHQINPFRLEFITDTVSLLDKKVLDVGCGGGILCEAMASQGANVTGLDQAKQLIQVAKMHQVESGLSIDYVHSTLESFSENNESLNFDVITCMELLEHVPDPDSLIAALAKCVKPGGHVFVSTLSRTAKAYLQAIIGAEYVLKLLPQGTHDYAKFIKPRELNKSATAHGLKLQKLTGLTYNPLTKEYRLTQDVSVNYLAHFVREA